MPSASSAHSKAAPAGAEANVNVAVVLSVMNSVVEPGPLRIVVTAGAVTVQARPAGDGSRLPAASVARTRNWCGPASSSISWKGERHELKAEPSTAHWKVAPAS